MEWAYFVLGGILALILSVLAGAWLFCKMLKVAGFPPPDMPGYKRKDYK